MTTQSLSIQPTLTGYIAKGIALYGKKQGQDAEKAFDIAFMFTKEDSKTVHFLLLIKAGYNLPTYSLLQYSFQAIALFNTNQCEDEISRVQELADACPDADTHACRVVKVSIIH